MPHRRRSGRLNINRRRIWLAKPLRTQNAIPGGQYALCPPPRPKPSIYELKITLLEIAPPIWRRIQVPSTMPLCCLHDAIQAVMGWTDSHLHQFEKDGKYWGDPRNNEFDDGGTPRAPLNGVQLECKQQEKYTSRFGSAVLPDKLVIVFSRCSRRGCRAPPLE